MTDIHAVAVVGMGAVLPDAHDPQTFWNNIQASRSSISEVTDDRWRSALYYHPDQTVPNKTYSKIGSWVRGFQFDAIKWGFAIPPRVIDTMDMSQRWAIAATRQALLDYGFPQRSLDTDRVAVIIGNTLAGENHYDSTMRIRLPEYMDALSVLPDFQALPPATREALLKGMQAGMLSKTHEITEDTMPGELPNIIAGRVANVFNFHGPNFVTDAACASTLAAVQSAMEGLLNHQFDAAITGGVDRNMGAESFVKFSKIGALSPDGSRPYADGANGFVMGEGCGIFLLKRLADAEKDGDKIYAVIRGVGGSSDGRGKGITAPNPTGQQRAVERAWKYAGLNPATATLIEGHGTSTRVGDVTEVASLNAIFGSLGLPANSIALGSVKSNLGHLKSASGAAALIKMAYSLYEKKLPPSINFHKPNPQIDFSQTPFYVNSELRPWNVSGGNIRRAGISSFGFGGTNFHMVIEEHIPGLLTDEKRSYPALNTQKVELTMPAPVESTHISLHRGLMFLSAATPADLRAALQNAHEQVKNGKLPENVMPSRTAIARPERLAIDYSSVEDLTKKIERTLKVMQAETPAAWYGLTAQAVYRGSGQPGKVAFLFPGQGSQYVNMLRELRDAEPLVADVYREADEVMTPILGRSLTSYIFVDGDETSLAQAENDLKNTAITQPAMLAANVSILRLMQKFGYAPDLVIGHSLGEYAALVASGVLNFGDALKIVAARGREMTRIKMDDNGCMAAVSAPLAEVERILASINGYIVIANINSPQQSVIGGATTAVDAAIDAFTTAGFQAVKLPVSHAFHTQIVAPASDPLGRVIESMAIYPARVPVVANVTGELYPSGREAVIEMLKKQIASPVQFIKGMQTLYAQGCRVFVEIGPKRVLNALANDIYKDYKDVSVLATNHPRKGGLVSFNEALCGLLAAGVLPAAAPAAQAAPEPARVNIAPATPAPAAAVPTLLPGQLALTGSVVISGAGLGLPGRSGSVFDDANVQHLLNGEMRIEPIPVETRQNMLDKRVTRLVKSDAGAVLQVLDGLDQTIKLAGQRGQFDLAADFGLPAERVDVYDISTQLAIAAGIEALHNAGIPLMLRYRQTSTGSSLPDRWMLPPALSDETGVIFASAFPGLDRMAEESDRYYQYEMLKRQANELRQMLTLVPSGQVDLLAVVNQRIGELETQMAAASYTIDRKYVFRVLTMGHSQFAEYIGARGPNGHVNAACASTTHAVSLAEDWIRAGRARRVIVIAGDDVTSGSLPGWVATSLMASGAATVEGDLRLAALPFDRRRNGMIMGMGAAGLVVESADAARERGMRAIAEVLSTQVANSAFHGTRLDVNHVSDVMERLVSSAENRFGLRRAEMASHMVFVSHETYTPARGGSAAAEIRALRRTFGDNANQVVIANTKGYTGHTMGVGIEDVLAVKALENQVVPPIAHIDEGFEPDPDLGDLNLSKGGKYPINYALRLGAGFGSQVAMTLLRRIPGQGERINHAVYDRWLADMAGYEHAETEVVQRTLRIRNAGEPKKAPAQSGWRFGQGPVAWAESDQVSAPPAAALPAPSLAAAPAPAQVTQESIKNKVLAIVSEKTGYPADMLDLELDLEADLGIDTVKQAELFASVRETYAIPRREDLRLSDYNTLARVIEFVNESLGSAAQPAPAPTLVQAAPAPAAPAQASQESIKNKVLAIVSEKTGYPADMLDLELDLEADLGIDTVKQAELFATVRETYAIPRREDLRLSDYNTLARVIEFVNESLGTPVQPSPVLASAAPAPAAAQESIKNKVLAIVSEKTGYPADMLDLELDLEADLGIDTVKQAELFATVRETYAIPRREDLRLSDYNTLARVIEFVNESLGAPVQPAPAPALSAAAPAAAPAHTDDDSIKNKVLAIVSEKTGYPVDMLDLDLDLEADLGIDTVKQAELFATVRETYAIPRREDLRLSDYNTLARVIQFVRDGLETLKPAAGFAENGASQPAPDETETAAEAPASEIPALLRRVPMPVLRPRLDLCAPTGITLDDSQRVLLVADRGKTADSLARKLRARKVKVLTLPASLTALEMGEKVTELLKEGPINGVYFLPGLDADAPLTEISFAEWQAGTERRAFALYHIFRALSSTSFLVSATRFGGLHGLNEVCTATTPLSGLVCGFTKAIGQERPDLFVKVVDFEAGLPAAAAASRLIEETLSDPGIVEVGWEKDLRYGVTLLERPDGEPDFDLPKGSVFVVSGGSGAITSLIVLDLARATQGTFFLLDRNPLPDASDPDLQRLKTDRIGLVGEMMKRIAAAGTKATPALAEQRVANLERAAATLATLKQVEDLGGKAYYAVCDVTDTQSVQAAVQQVAQTAGHVDAFIHAAGIERSRHLESKPFDEFKLVVTVKTEGFYQIFKSLEAAGALPRAVVFFSSIAGRFGNSGQTDYSSANDMLSKTASVLKQQYPGIKAVSIDWGAWAVVGMSARGNIPELMKRAGIEMIHPSLAVPRVYAELRSGNGEVVVAGALGAMEALNQRASIDLERANAALSSAAPEHSMLNHVTGFHNQHGITLEALLDPTSEPFLKDHALNGISVLPGVMGIEGFSVAAQQIASTLAAEHGELKVSCLEDIQFLAPLKFYRDQPRTLTWRGIAVREAQGLVIHVVLESTMMLKTRGEQTLQHFSGKVYLQPAGQGPAAETKVEPPNWTDKNSVGPADIYRLFFHGPAFQVLEGVQTQGAHVLGKLNQHLPPFTRREHDLLSTPILVELCFQTAGIWEVGKTGIMALPHSLESLTLHHTLVNGETVYAEVSPVNHEDGTMSFDARVVDGSGRLYLDMHNYRTIGLPYTVEKNLIEPLQKLVDGDKQVIK